MNKCIVVLGGTCWPSAGALGVMGSLNRHGRFLADCPIFSLGQLQRFQVALGCSESQKIGRGEDEQSDRDSHFAVLFNTRNVKDWAASPKEPGLNSCSLPTVS